MRSEFLLSYLFKKRVLNTLPKMILLIYKNTVLIAGLATRAHLAQYKLLFPEAASAAFLIIELQICIIKNGLMKKYIGLQR